MSRECLFKSLFGLASEKHQILALRVFWWITFTMEELVMWKSNGNVSIYHDIIVHVKTESVPEFTGHRWIPRTKASDGELWCFLWSARE